MKRTVLLSAIILLGPLAAADEQSAAFFTGRGMKALEAKDYAEAGTQFRKALEEQAGYLPAVFGLARAAQETGDRDEAIRQLEAVLDAAGPAEPGSASSEAATAARDLLRALDRPRLEYRDMLEAYVAKLQALHQKYRESDPLVARKCLERLLAVCPNHPRVRDLEAASPAASPDADPPAAAPGETRLFNGQDFTGWAARSPRFVVKEGMVVCDSGSSTYIMHTEEALEGSYVVEFEARMTGGPSEDSAYGFGWGRRSQFEFFLVLVYADNVVVRCHRGSVEKFQVLGRRKNGEFQEPFDRKQWNLFRVEADGDRLRVSVNGEELLGIPATPGDLDGQVAVLVQQGTVEFRRIARVR